MAGYLFFLLFTLTSFGFSPHAFNWENAYNDISYPHDGMEATLFGYISAKKENQINKYNTIFPSDYFKSNQLKVHLHILQKNGKIQKAPLIVLIPGLGGDFDSPLYQRTFRRFVDKKFHVLLLPSVFSKEYLNEIPKGIPGDIRSDADANLSLIKIAQKSIGQDHIVKTHIYGESLGAFIIPVLLSRDFENRIDGIATLVGPPLNILKSIFRFDTLINETKEAWENGCQTYSQSFFSKLKLLLLNEQKQFPRPLKTCTKSFIAYSYQGIGMRIKQDLLRTKPDIFAPGSADKEFTFQNLSDDFLIGRTGNLEEDRLNYWINQSFIRGYPQENLQILSAEDDFINERNDWNSLNLILQNLILLRAGGHLGFEGYRSFNDFIEILASDLRN